ncbi:MAG: hypothetical protein KF767_12325 [Bdellovibrionaceae bacterium]|nr:hypothetical protein [Pseudobdellovibrionaceae bacterium]
MGNSKWRQPWMLATPIALIALLSFQNCGQHLQTSELSSEALDTRFFAADSDGLPRLLRDDDPNSGLDVRAPADIDIGRSVLITDHRVLDKVQGRVDFAVKLGDFYHYVRDNLNTPDDKMRAKRAGEFFARIFENAAEEQAAHAQVKDASLRVGDVPNADRRMDRIFTTWRSADTLYKQSRQELQGSPFRLLAVANLMDQAGNIDDRGTTEPTQNARALGEVHLVYGFVDPTYEKNGRVYPQTFVLSYRLPILEWRDGRLESLKGGNKDVDMDKLMKDDATWRWRLKWWARLWAGLSQYAPTSPEYQARLARILELAVQPENFMNIRSNTKINERSFEMREWYLLNTNLQLIPRKPRAEPYRCLSGGKLLTKFVNSFWRADKGDLDVFGYKKPAVGVARRNSNGYTVYRDVAVPFFENLTNADGVKMGSDGVAASFDGCGQNKNNMPYEMWSDQQEEKSPRFTAPFATFRDEGQIWKLAAGAPEERRHAFAIRTCSGCHSQEGAAKGFHIFPRAQGADAQLSPFLTGRGANKFTHAGVTYKYTQLADRQKHLYRAFERQAELYEGLQRRDTD